MIQANYFETHDCVRIAWRELGEGRPLLLIHGFMSEADTNWIKYGHAAALAQAGYRVIMPDLRAHGLSGKPHDPKYYPRDVLADDQFALLAHLNITDYDLGGYSLGGRTVSRMLARGAQQGRAIISGMGLEGLTQTGGRSIHFRKVFDNLGKLEQGSARWKAMPQDSPPSGRQMRRSRRSRPSMPVASPATRPTTEPVTKPIANFTD